MVLRVDGLCKSFGGQVVLDDVALELRRGEVILLEGENGSGKTTLLNILTGNLEPDAGTIHYSANQDDAEFTFPQAWWKSLNLHHRFSPDKVARLGFGRTWQDVRLFDSLTLQENIEIGRPDQRTENPVHALISFRDETATVSDGALSRLGLAGRENSSGDKISLGQSKRVAIARAIASGAEVLFLDEPLAGLDGDGINDVLAMLSELVERHGITIVIVEHAFNQTHLRDLITSHWHLADGKLTLGPASEITTRPSHETPHWFQMLTDAADEVITKPLPRGATLTRFRIADRYEDNPVLEIKDLIVKRGKRTVIGLDDEGKETGFNLTINEGEIAVLQAPNGWGKSTLLDSIAGVIACKSEYASCESKVLQQTSILDRYRQGIRYLAAPAIGFKSLSLKELSQLGGVDTNDIHGDLSFSELSGGQKQRVLFPDLQSARSVLLDEPFNAMDSKSTEMLGRQLLDANVTVFIAVPTVTVH